MKIQSSACLGIKTTRVLMKMLMWVFLTTWRPSDNLFYFTNMMIITTPDMLDCTRSVSPSSGLFLHCVTETGLKYRVECRTRTCAGWWETRAIITKRQNKATTEACAVFFFSFRETLLQKRATTHSFYSRQSVKGNLCSLCMCRVSYSAVLIAKFTAELMNWDI